MPFLTAENGPEAGTRYDLEDGEYILGRHPDCDIVIDVGAVSRHHCKVIRQAAECFVEDLKSRNGTYVNDDAIDSRRTLGHRDKIRVCDVVFTFHTELRPEAGRTLDDSSYRAVVVDDDPEETKGGSSIMSKLEVVKRRSGSSDSVQLTASPEAKLNALIEITKSLGKALSLDMVLPQVLDSLFRIFVQADRGFIGLLNDQGQLIPRWTKLRREDDDETIRISRTIANEVLQSKEAILSADATSDSRFDMSQSIADFRIRSMLCAPLLDSDGNPIGMLQIDTMDQRQKFQEEDLELLVGAASQAAIAIDNAQLHEEALKRRTLERDLELAHDVQQTFLPRCAPHVEGYDFFDYYQAADQVGGDYYDYLQLADGRLAVVVADVVGHGIAAAMLMAKLSAEAGICLASEANPAVAVTTLNHRLCELGLDRFVTLVIARLNPETHEVAIVSAGHMPPIIRRQDGTIEEPGKAEAGVPLGIIDGMEYQLASVQLQPGESLTLYTDGLDEAANEDGKQYTIGRMKEQIETSDGSPAEIGSRILEDVRSHLNGRPQDDDMCLVALRRI